MTLGFFISFPVQSDIVVTGVPTKAYRLPSEWIKEGESRAADHGSDIDSNCPFKINHTADNLHDFCHVKRIDYPFCFPCQKEPLW